MTDTRFFRAAGPFTLDEVAAWLGASLADPAQAERSLHDIADLDQAGETHVSLFWDRRLADAFTASNAGAILTSAKFADLPHKGALILSNDPRLDFARLGHLFYPKQPPQGVIHRSAVIAASAKIGEGSDIGPGAVIGEHVIIGPRSRIGANVVIADHVTIGENADIGANTVISHAMIGASVSIATNVSIGGPGFGFVPSPQGPLRQPQIGRVIIEDGVDIGSNCAIDRGGLTDTVIGAWSALDNLVQIGHNVKIGKGCVFAGQSGVAGSVTIGDYVMVGGGVSISDHLTVGSGAKIAGKSGVAWNVAPGEIVAGYPAVPVRQWHRQSAALTKLAQRKSEE